MSCGFRTTLAVYSLVALLQLDTRLATGTDTAAAPWPEADALFHRDPSWRGGDGAGSIDLGAGRVLWLFGDSFVAPRNAPPGRQAAKLVNNTVGIQQGYDPVTASFKTYHKIQDGKPAAFFAGTGKSWLWPSGGALVGDSLLVLLMRIESTGKGLGFRVIGNHAVLIDNPGESPDRWNARAASPPAFDLTVIYGSGGMLSESQYLLAVTPSISPGHSLFLNRWPVESVLTGNLKEPQWWDGEQWASHGDLTALPRPLLPLGASESSHHWDTSAQRFLQVQASSFPYGVVMIRSALSRTGTWSEQRAVFNPAQHADAPKGMHFYSAKAHPEQVCNGLAITYCSNAFDLGRVVRDESVYYPRFIRLPADFAREDNQRP